MSPLTAVMIAPLIVWIGVFLYMLRLDLQVKELKRKQDSTK
ncbi:MAG: CcmD family protein [Armatimonadota bacterium]|nr:CcmD family protein [Armatimonadota bacterium]